MSGGKLSERTQALPDHFRTQITRTTAALAASAPVLPLAGVTDCAARNLRNVSVVARVADAGAAAAPALATTASLSCTMPSRRPWASSAAAPSKPGGGAGRMASPLRRAATVDDRGAAALRLRIGDADQRQVGTLGAFVHVSAAGTRSQAP